MSEREPFTTTVHARWGEMDQNGHMRTSAYLAVAEDVRMQYFAAHGFPMPRFLSLGIGPVVQGDDLRYRAELRLLEDVTVELAMDGLSPDGARFRMRNTFVRRDGMVACAITSTGGWLDLTERRLVAPPDDLAALLAGMTRTDDFEELVSPLARVV